MKNWFNGHIYLVEAFFFACIGIVFTAVGANSVAIILLVMVLASCLRHVERNNPVISKLFGLINDFLLGILILTTTIVAYNDHQKGISIYIAFTVVYAAIMIMSIVDFARTKKKYTLDKQKVGKECFHTFVCPSMTPCEECYFNTHSAEPMNYLYNSLPHDCKLCEDTSCSGCINEKDKNKAYDIAFDKFPTLSNADLKELRYWDR